MTYPLSNNQIAQVDEEWTVETFSHPGCWTEAVLVKCGDEIILRLPVEMWPVEYKKRQWKKANIVADAHNASLRKAKTTALKDTERLDWLSKHFLRVDEVSCRQSVHVGLLTATFEQGHTLREAIDSAMQASRPALKEDEGITEAVSNHAGAVLQKKIKVAALEIVKKFLRKDEIWLRVNSGARGLLVRETTEILSEHFNAAGAEEGLPSQTLPPVGVQGREKDETTLSGGVESRHAGSLPAEVPLRAVSPSVAIQPADLPTDSESSDSPAQNLPQGREKEQDLGGKDA